MTVPSPVAEAAEPSPWVEAATAAALFCVDPAGIGGAVLRSLTGPARDRWLEIVRESLPAGAPVRRVPLHITDGRLLGGLDLAATLRAGRPIVERGLLAECDGGVVQVAMAERLPEGTAAKLAAVIDAGEVVLERDGIAQRTPSRFGVVALDEGLAEDERPPATLVDRLAFLLDLSTIDHRDIIETPYGADDIAEARARLPRVTVGDNMLEALCGTGLALGVDSIRGSLLAVKVARAAAALAGHDTVEPADAQLAARLVLAPRATRMPMMEPPPDQQAPEEPPPPPENQERDQNDQDQDQPPELDLDKPLDDVILEAAQAAIPAALLAQLQVGGLRIRSKTSGRAGAQQQAAVRGRPVGTRRGEPRAGVRLNVVETLRSAAPWQTLRRREKKLLRQQAAPAEVVAEPTVGETLAEVLPLMPVKKVRRRAQPGPRIEVRKDDFRITRFKHRSETTTIFVVDASGSSALHRLAEAKGAVELLLADCYVRRDQVALIAFRGRGAELLLPPTRSLVRAKRSLASLPGGGGTPLAAGIDAAVALADAVKHKGQTPSIVFLTDGRPNVGRDGKGGRPRAEEDALAAARLARTTQLTVLMVDTSPHPQPFARKLANEMGALYLPLPYADAHTVSRAVRVTTDSVQRSGMPSDWSQVEWVAEPRRIRGGMPHGGVPQK